MANRPAPFTQAEVTRILKAYRDAGQPAPVIVFEPQRITVKPAGQSRESDPNPWDEKK